jgi:hypothetical protein
MHPLLQVGYRVSKLEKAAIRNPKTKMKSIANAGAD